MNDPRHTDSLLWYVDGNLDVETAGEVELHLARCAECRREVESLRELRSVLRQYHDTSHAPVRLEDLIAFEEGSEAVSPARRTEIENHLSTCTSCSADLAALREARLEGEETPAGHPGAGAEEPLHTRRGLSRRLWVGAAAVVLLGTALSTFWLFRPSSSDSVTFLPVQRGPEQLSVLRGRGPWSITLVLPFDAPAGTYLVRIEDENGSAVRGHESLSSLESEGHLSIGLRALPRPGDYRMIASPETPVAGEPYTYPFRLQPRQETAP